MPLIEKSLKCFLIDTKRSISHNKQLDNYRIMVSHSARMGSPRTDIE